MDVFLETERLRLRAFVPADADLVLELHNDPEVMRFINGGLPTTREEVQDRTMPHFLHDYPGLGARGFWAAEEKRSGDFLGWFEFRPLDEHSAAVVELGYRLHRAAWGWGYATEGARALIGKGFAELGVERVTANTMAVNIGSRRVMEKSGLSFVRAFIADWPYEIDGSEHGDVEYDVTRDRWRTT